MAANAAEAAMIKAIVCLAVTVACGLVGRAFASRYGRRAALMQQACMALCALRDDIAVKKLTLTDALHSCAGRYALFAEMLESVAALIESDPGLPISTAWERATAELAEATDADRRTVAEAGGDLEALCTANDPARLNMRVTQMKETAEAARAAAQSKGKAYTCVGVLIGVFISVLVY